jgi:hypothetical protein
MPQHANAPAVPHNSTECHHPVDDVGLVVSAFVLVNRRKYDWVRKTNRLLTTQLRLIMEHIVEEANNILYFASD